MIMALSLKFEDYKELKARAEMLGYDLVTSVDLLQRKRELDVVILKWNWIEWDKNSLKIKFLGDFLEELKEKRTTI